MNKTEMSVKLPGNVIVKEPGSALSHFIAFLLSIMFMPLLLFHGFDAGLNNAELLSLAVFSYSMILLYGASTAYHTFDISPKGNLLLKKLDHMMIFVLIAGSYTPICLIHLAEEGGYRLLMLVWSIALLGFIFTFFWVTCPKWVSSVIYIGMGWVCVLALPQIFASLPVVSFALLLAGGILYTAGGVIYALKFKVFGGKYENFGPHEVFHLFVVAGTMCHYLAMYLSF